MLWLFVAVALSNDTFFGGAASALVPLNDTVIEMASEDITLSSDGQAHAVYVFHNPTSDEVTLQVGFPEEECPPEPESDCGAGFDGLITRVRGVPVATTTGAVGERPDWAPAVGKVHLFDVTFGANETVEIVHDYRFSVSASAMGDAWITYLTRTGAAWAGTIGRARFTVFLDGPVSYFDHPNSYPLVANAETTVPGGSRRVVSFEMTDWTPTADFELYWQRGDQPYGGSEAGTACPALQDYGFAWDDVNAVRKLGTKMLRLCRNELFARHGYSFSSPELSELFYEVHARDVGEDKTRVRFVPNPLYDEALLTERERMILDRIKGAESR